MSLFNKETERRAEYALQAMMNGLVSSINLPTVLELLINYCESQAQMPDTGRVTADTAARLERVRASWREAAVLLRGTVEAIKKINTGV